MASHFPDPRSAAFAFIRQEEGGYKAPGVLGDSHAAYAGVNDTTYDAYRMKRGLAPQSVADISPVELSDIMTEYWIEGHSPEVAAFSGAGAIVHADAWFNGGGGVLLQRTLGMSHEQQDGVIGPLTLELLANGFASGEDAFCMAYLQNRLDRFRNLTSWPEAGHVWSGRLNRLAGYIGVNWTAT